MRGVVEEPAGLRYVPDFLTEAQEEWLLERLTKLEYGEVRMHGQVARRVVRHYGTSYHFETGAVTPGEPMPGWLQPVRERCAALLDRPTANLAEALATFYPPGASIGWHRDAPEFGDVVGISLGSPTPMRFQLGKGTERRVWEQWLEPRSAYVLAGPVRTRWQHHIPAVREPRYSLTFRTLRHGFAERMRGAAGDGPGVGESDREPDW